MVTIGILLAYCFAIGTREIQGAGSWRTVIGIGFVFVFTLGVGVQFMPESPVCPSNLSRLQAVLALTSLPLLAPPAMAHAEG